LHNLFTYLEGFTNLLVFFSWLATCVLTLLQWSGRWNNLIRGRKTGQSWCNWSKGWG